MSEEQKVIVIVGASSGIGAAISKELSEDNNLLILVGRRENRLREVQKSLRGESQIAVCDLSSNDQLTDLFEKIQEKGVKLSGLVYCAGVWALKPCKAMEPGEIERIFQINLFSFYEMCRLFVSPKISVKGASILGMSSIASLRPEAGISAYAMSKSAMNSMVKVLACEFMKREIRINAILPADTMSKMGVGEEEYSEEECQSIKQYQPLGVIPLKEVAEVAKFLISDSSKHMTGELITISGGYQGKGK